MMLCHPLHFLCKNGLGKWPEKKAHLSSNLSLSLCDFFVSLSSDKSNPTGIVVLVQMDSHPKSADAEDTHKMMMMKAVFCCGGVKVEMLL